MQCTKARWYCCFVAPQRYAPDLHVRGAHPTPAEACAGAVGRGVSDPFAGASRKAEEEFAPWT